MHLLQYAPGAEAPVAAASCRQRLIARTCSEFERLLVLQIGKLSINEQLIVVIPQSESRMWAVARSLSAEAPNIAICADPGCAFRKGERGPDGRFDIVRAVATGLQCSENLWDPDNGMELPEVGEISLERDLGLTATKMKTLESALTDWRFDTHMYTRDELVGISVIIFRRLLSAPDLDPALHLNEKELVWFLLICRAYYRNHVYYHTFYHCIDVLQSIYLLHKSFNPWHLNGTDILAHVLAALGHDLLHPGLTSGILRQSLPEFSKKFGCLETYHSHVFLAVLRRMWPAAATTVHDIVKCNIAATELEKHASYLGSACSLHSIKFADLVNVARPGLMAAQRSAIDIFLEMRTQHIVCETIGAEPMKFTVDPALPAAQVLVGMQVMFLTKIACPYFDWLSEQFEVFKPFAETARNHLRRWQSMQQSGNLDLAVPFSPPAASGYQPHGIPLFHAIP